MAITDDDFICQVSMQLNTGLPKDRVVNTYAMRRDLDLSPDVEALAEAVAEPYTLTPQLFSAGAFMQTGLTHTVKVYRLIDAEPRLPVAEFAWSELGSGGGALPLEVAICSSFAAEYQTGTNPARRRGRVYLGGLSSGTLDSSVGLPRISSTAQQAAADLVKDVATGAFDAGYRLCVWSRTDQVFRQAVRGWVNNEFDTQRRRGADPTARVSYSMFD